MQQAGAATGRVVKISRDPRYKSAARQVCRPHSLPGGEPVTLVDMCREAEPTSSDHVCMLPPLLARSTGPTSHAPHTSVQGGLGSQRKREKKTKNGVRKRETTTRGAPIRT
eukprot:3190000-Prymnesium_polylepis.1